MTPERKILCLIQRELIAYHKDPDRYLDNAEVELEIRRGWEQVEKKPRIPMGLQVILDHGVMPGCLAKTEESK